MLGILCFQVKVTTHKTSEFVCYHIRVHSDNGVSIVQPFCVYDTISHIWNFVNGSLPQDSMRKFVNEFRVHPSHCYISSFGCLNSTSNINSLQWDDGGYRNFVEFQISYPLHVLYRLLFAFARTVIWTKRWRLSRDDNEAGGNPPLDHLTQCFYLPSAFFQGIHFSFFLDTKYNSTQKSLIFLFFFYSSLNLPKPLDIFCWFTCGFTCVKNFLMTGLTYNSLIFVDRFLTN